MVPSTTLDRITAVTVASPRAQRPAWMRSETEVSLYQGRDRVAEEAIASADRAMGHRAKRRRSGASPSSQGTDSSLLEFGTEVEQVVRRANHVYGVAQDLNGRAYGVERDRNWDWTCRCMPGVKNPGCRHQQAVQAQVPAVAR